MKTLNNNTKKAQAYIYAYNHSDIYSLNQAYGRPSTEKIKADSNCRLMMLSEDGHNYKIIGYNSSFFTVAWIAGDALRIETYANSFVIPNAAE